MGKRGPQKKPQEIKRLEGNPGKRAMNPDAVKASGSPDMPDYLDDYAAGVWDRVLGSMPPSLYAACDADLLAAYCQAASLHRQAIEEIEKSGAVAYGEKGAPYQSPWVSIKNKQAELMRSLGARLGLDPATRDALQVKSDDKEPASKFEGLLAIQGGQSA